MCVKNADGLSYWLHQHEIRSWVFWHAWQDFQNLLQPRLVVYDDRDKDGGVFCFFVKSVIISCLGHVDCEEGWIAPLTRIRYNWAWSTFGCTLSCSWNASRFSFFFVASVCHGATDCWAISKSTDLHTQAAYLKPRLTTSSCFYSHWHAFPHWNEKQFKMHQITLAKRAVMKLPCFSSALCTKTFTTINYLLIPPLKTKNKTLLSIPLWIPQPNFFSWYSAHR